MNPHAVIPHWHLKPACLPFHHSPGARAGPDGPRGRQGYQGVQRPGAGHNRFHMGVARQIEQRLEGMVEGFFSRLFRSGLQPVEVGRRIVREMAENKTVSVNRVYVPNDFHVRVGPEDHERFAAMEAGLQREFTELVIDTAKQNRWNLMGMPRVSFERDDTLHKGQFRIEASLSADPDAVPPPASTRQPSEADLSATSAISVTEAGRLGIRGSGARLEILHGGDKVEDISITRSPVTIGRLSSNDIVLSDNNVSRRHAELRREGDRWVIVDLDSTNGTLVNGKLTREHPLSDGDRLTFGRSEMIFRLGGED